MEDFFPEEALTETIVITKLKLPLRPNENYENSFESNRKDMIIRAPSFQILFQ